MRKASTLFLLGTQAEQTPFRRVGRGLMKKLLLSCRVEAKHLI
jgi:hypothetical protein